MVPMPCSTLHSKIFSPGSAVAPSNRSVIPSQELFYFGSPINFIPMKGNFLSFAVTLPDSGDFNGRPDSGIPLSALLYFQHWSSRFYFQPSAGLLLQSFRGKRKNTNFSFLPMKRENIRRAKVTFSSYSKTTS